MTEQQPGTILILGGLGGDQTRLLLPYLLTKATPSPAFVRIVDKYLIIPQADAYTTYIDKETRTALKEGTAKGVVEYLQGNLLTEATRTRAFTLPEAHGGPTKGFSTVFDFTGAGEGDFEAPEPVHIERTLRQALLLGETAIKHNTGAYIRALNPYYRVADGKKGKVGDEGAIVEPWGTRAKWYHEAGRGLAAIQGLKLVLVRNALIYGPYTVTGVTPRVLIGEVYKYEGEKLEFLWAEGLAQNTVSSIDLASALFSIATYANSTPHATLLSSTSEDLPSTLQSNDQIKDVSGATKKEQLVKAAVFSIVDDGETTQKDIANVIADVVGVQAGFHGTVISTFAKMNMNDVTEDVNDKHLEGWSALLTASDPPMSTTIPISPHVASDLLQPYPISYNASKLKSLTGWKPTQRLTKAVVQDTIALFKSEGNWPNAAPKSKKKK